MPRPTRFASPLTRSGSRPRRERGASLVEYVLLVALIAAVCVGAVTLLGTSANTKLTTAADALK